MFAPSSIFDLDRDLFHLVFGEIVFVAGIIACALYLLRWRRWDKTELYMGLAALLYGGRLIAEIGLLESGVPFIPWAQIVNLITLVVGIPFVLFVGCTLLPPRSWYVRIVVAAQCLLVLAGVLTRIAGGTGSAIT